MKILRFLTAAFFTTIFLTGIVRGEELNSDISLIPQSLIEDYGNGAGVAPGKVPRKILPVGMSMIKYFEKWMPNAYNDPVGYCTIGYGHLIALKRCEDIQLGSFASELSVEEGEKLLEEDTQSSRLAVQKLVIVDLSDDQFSALAVFTFNVGKANFQKSTLLALLNENEFEKAAKQFERWVNSKGVKLDGLVTRRACEATLFVSSLAYDANGSFSTRLCQTMGLASNVEKPVDVLLGE